VSRTRARTAVARASATRSDLTNGHNLVDHCHDTHRTGQNTPTNKKRSSPGA
jgi:hypothetical protein